MIIQDITKYLEEVAPLALQESYDNSGLIIGNAQNTVSGILVTLDITEDVIQEAIDNKLNLIVAHHPIVFSGLKKINGNNYVERCVIKAIKKDIAIYASHTNSDNIFYNGVNSKISERLGLKNCKILSPVKGKLNKIVVFAPNKYANNIRKAMFNAGAGKIGNYDSCSYNNEGYGTFRANEKSNPYVGKIGEQHTEPETRIETIIPDYLTNKVISAIIKEHPYEEVAYDIYELKNTWTDAGAGIIGELEKPQEAKDFLQQIKQIFNCGVLRYTNIAKTEIKRVAICGGSGSFLLQDAIRAKADIFITGDFKYHQFFDAENKIIIADIGHFESEQFTKELFYELLTRKFPNFAVRSTKIKTNPIKYL